MGAEDGWWGGGGGAERGFRGPVVVPAVRVKQFETSLLGVSVHPEL